MKEPIDLDLYDSLRDIIGDCMYHSMSKSATPDYCFEEHIHLKNWCGKCKQLRFVLEAVQEHLAKKK